MPNPIGKEYGYWHVTKNEFNLKVSDDTKNKTILPLFMSDQAKSDPTAINVNPQNENFSAKTTSPATYMGSRVNKMYLRVLVSHKFANGATSWAYVYKSGLISNTFDDLLETDSAGVTLADKIGLQVESSNQDTIHPKWSGTDLNNGSNLHADVAGLTGGQGIESISGPDSEDLEDDFKEDELRGLIKKAYHGHPTSYIARREAPFFNEGWVDVDPRLIKQQKQTFCGLYFDVPHNDYQFIHNGDIPAADAIRFYIECWFKEYNDDFNQRP